MAQINDKVDMATEEIEDAEGAFRSALKQDLLPGNGVGITGAIENLKNAQESRNEVAYFAIRMQVCCACLVFTILHVQLKIGQDQTTHEVFRLQGHPVPTNGNEFITHGLQAAYFKGTTVSVAELMANPPTEADKERTVGTLNFEVS